jgi:hypothetical protein
MKLNDACNGCAIQSRNIDITSTECGEAHIVVCGQLCDRRRVPTTDLKGNPRKPGIVHQMRICMKVATDTLAIEEIEAEMRHVPHEECAEMHRSVDQITGLRLTPGFSSRVKKKLGGPRGCIHLTTLLLAMAPAALQGYWVQNDRRPERRQISGEHLKRYLVDTCRVWRREGPLVKQIADAAGIELPETSGRPSSSVK